MKKYICLLILVTSCSSSGKIEKKLTGFKEFVSSLEVQSQTMTDKSWADADWVYIDFNSFFDNEMQGMMTIDQRNELKRLKSRYYDQKASYKLTLLEGFIEEVASESPSFNEKDWELIDSTFNDYLLFFTDQESRLISDQLRNDYNNLAGEYEGIKTAATLLNKGKDWEKELQNFGKKAEGFLEGVKKVMENRN